MSLQFLRYLLERSQAGVPLGEAQRVQLVDAVVFPAGPLPSAVAPAEFAAHGDQRTRPKVGTLDPAGSRVLALPLGPVVLVEYEPVPVAGGWRPAERRVPSLEPPKLAVGGLGQVDRPAGPPRAVAGQPDPIDVRLDVDDGVPGPAILVEEACSVPAPALTRHR